MSPDEAGFIAILVPAWDEASVIASMLRAALKRIEHSNYQIFVGYYRNDPATAAAIASVSDSASSRFGLKPMDRRPRPIASTIFTTR